MNDQTWAVLIGAGTMAGLSVINALVRWFFPPGRASSWAMRHSQPVPDDDDKGKEE